MKTIGNFALFRKRLLCGTWQTEDIYKEVEACESLTAEESKELKEIYDLRQFSKTELLTGLAYDLIDKESPEDNAIRNSLSEVLFINNKYNLTFAERSSATLLKWREQAESTLGVSVLACKIKATMFSSEYHTLNIFFNGREIILENVTAKEFNTLQENPHNLEAALESILETRGYQIPFTYCTRDFKGEIFLPRMLDGSKFCWKHLKESKAIDEIEVVSTNEICRFIKPLAAETNPSTLEWHDKAIKFIALRQKDLVAGTYGKITLLCPGTHSMDTLRADAESSAGHDTFAKHKKEFVNFTSALIRSYELPVEIEAVGHSLGGALAQLSIAAIVEMAETTNPEIRSKISRLTLSVKNPTGVKSEVVVKHEASTRRLGIPHTARYIYVDCDPVQQTGQDTLCSNLDFLKHSLPTPIGESSAIARAGAGAGAGAMPAMPQTRLISSSLIKLSSRIIYAAPTAKIRDYIAIFSAVTFGATMSIAALPLTTSALCAGAIFGTGIPLIAYLGAKTFGGIKAHTLKAFTGGISSEQLNLSYFNNNTDEGAKCIYDELKNKSQMAIFFANHLTGASGKTPAAELTAKDLIAKLTPIMPTLRIME